MKNIAFVIFSLLCSTHFLAQNYSLQTNKDVIEIGEPLELTLTVKSDKKLDSLQYDKSKNQLIAKSSNNNGVSITNEPYPLELLDYFKDTLYKENNLYVWQGKYKLTAWDSAFVIITDQHFTLFDSTYYFQPVLIEVKSPATDPTKDIFDIKEYSSNIAPPEHPIVTFMKNNSWWILIVSFVIVSLIVLQIFKNKKIKTKEPSIILNPKEEALIAIKQLQQSNLIDENLKEYYFQLSIIIRIFLSKHYQENYRDKTTKEIERTLLHQDLNEDTINTCVILLSQSDMVKFAKSKPSEAEILRTTNKAKQIIVEIADISVKTSDNL